MHSRIISKKFLLIFLSSFCFTSHSLASTITVPFTGTVYQITDPNNLLQSDLNLHVNEGDSYSASYALNDNLLPYSTSMESTYNFSDPSISFNANFGPGGNVSNINELYRLTILNNYASPGYDGVDVWATAAAVGFGTDANSEHYLHILNFMFIDTGQDKHDSTDLYFENSTAGWDYAGISISQWYADLDDRNTVLLSTLPVTPIPLPPAGFLLLGAILSLLITNRRRSAY